MIILYHPSFITKVINDYKYHILPSCPKYAVVSGLPSNYHPTTRGILYLYNYMSSSYFRIPNSFSYPVFNDRNIAQIHCWGKDLLVELNQKVYGNEDINI